MQVSQSSETTFTFTPSDIRELIVEWIKKNHGHDVRKDSIRFDVSGGDPGGYGSYGDPSYVYNPPTDPSFNGATVRVTKLS